MNEKNEEKKEKKERKERKKKEAIAGKESTDSHFFLKQLTTNVFTQRFRRPHDQSRPPTPKKKVFILVVVVAFCSLASIWGDCSSVHSPPALFFLLFFYVEVSSRTLIPRFRPESVHSGSAS